MIASAVLKHQTNKKGLCGPSQLTNEKLNILITTPTISIVVIYFRMNVLIIIHSFNNLIGAITFIKHHQVVNIL